MNSTIDSKFSALLAARKKGQNDTSVHVGSIGQRQIYIGGCEPVFIAGPCSLEAEASAVCLANKLKNIGVDIFRAMLFKPRSNPYSFQGLGEAGVNVLDEIKKQTSMLLLTEVRSESEADMIAAHTDILQIGTRNMSNFQLLRHVGTMNKPVILKRGMGATIKEWLCAAEYILAAGNPDVILCERGIRTFEPYTRFTLDISAIPAAKELTHLPVIADPSHSSGRRSFIKPLSRAILAAGADGVMIEVHEHPEESISDSEQSISYDAFADIKAGSLQFL